MNNIIGFILFISLIFSSCATLFNSPSQYLTIITSEPSGVVVNNDSIKILSTERELFIKRNEKPLSISAYNDHKEKNVTVRSRNSLAYWANIYSWGIGFLFDDNAKRYAYPQTIYLDMKSNQNNYLTFRPLDSITSKYNNIIKITPLKTIDFTNPGLEISYERKLSNSFSTQFMASYLFPNSFLISDDIEPNIKGSRVAIEEKYYFKKSTPKGPYISLELNYMNNQSRHLGYFHLKDADSHPDDIYTSYSDTFGIKKQTLSINFKVGYQFIIDHLCIDIYAGLGPRYKDVVYFDTIKPDDELKGRTFIDYETNLKGKYWTLSMPLNVRIGWIF